MAVATHTITSFIMSSNEETNMTDIINKLQAFADAIHKALLFRHTTDELTYQQLMDESSKLAHRLQGSKKPNDFIRSHVTIYDCWDDWCH